MKFKGKPMNSFLVLAAAIMVASFVGWYLGIAAWGAYSLYQFNVLMGQGVISAGIIVIILEMQEQWYDE